MAVFQGYLYKIYNKFISKLKSNDSECLQQQYKQECRCNKFNHDYIKPFSGEFAASACHLIYYYLWTYYPANEDTCGKCNDWHKHIVAYIIHDIKYLSDCAVWKLNLHIELIVAKADYYLCNQTVYRD